MQGFGFKPNFPHVYHTSYCFFLNLHAISMYQIINLTISNTIYTLIPTPPSLVRFSLILFVSQVNKCITTPNQWNQTMDIHMMKSWINNAYMWTAQFNHTRNWMGSSLHIYPPIPRKTLSTLSSLSKETSEMNIIHSQAMYHHWWNHRHPIPRTNVDIYLTRGFNHKQMYINTVWLLSENQCATSGQKQYLCMYVCLYS
mgnify:CR=1 FL=1